MKAQRHHPTRLFVQHITRIGRILYVLPTHSGTRSSGKDANHHDATGRYRACIYLHPPGYWTHYSLRLSYQHAHDLGMEAIVLPSAVGTSPPVPAAHSQVCSHAATACRTGSWIRQVGGPWVRRNNFLCAARTVRYWPRKAHWVRFPLSPLVFISRPSLRRSCMLMSLARLSNSSA